MGGWGGGGLLLGEGISYQAEGHNSWLSLCDSVDTNSFTMFFSVLSGEDQGGRGGRDWGVGRG